MGFIRCDCNTHTTRTYDAQTLSQQFRLVKLELQVVTQIRHPMIVNFMGVAVKFPTANENPNCWYFVRHTHTTQTYRYFFWMWWEYEKKNWIALLSWFTNSSICIICEVTLIPPFFSPCLFMHVSGPWVWYLSCVRADNWTSCSIPPTTCLSTTFPRPKNWGCQRISL